MGVNAEKEWDRVKHYGANELGDVLRETLAEADDLAEAVDALRAKVAAMEACIRAGDKLTEAVDESEEEGFECGAGVFFACEAYYAARRGVDLPVAPPAPDDELTDEQVAAATERFRERLRRMRKDIGPALDRAHEASGVVTSSSSESVASPFAPGGTSTEANRLRADLARAGAALRALHEVFDFSEDAKPYETWGASDPTKQNEAFALAREALNITKGGGE